jgi:predicted metal-dependent HD superfamily phosphohydrolase
VEQELRDRWTSVAGTGRAAEQAVAGLLSRYREPHRSYHGLAHVVRVLRTVDDLVLAVEVDDADAVRFGAWFHDAVYDPRAHDNEAASARLAIEVLAELGQPAARATQTATLVEATAGHVPTNAAEAVLIDADLAVLGADPAAYEAYARGVRKEYAHVDDEAWRAGRAAVLQGFLGRPAIFHTPPMAASEARARANLAAELAGLRAPGVG